MSQGSAAFERLRRRTRRWLADNLRAERKRLGLSQEKAAEEVGFSLQYVQRIERQIVKVPLDTICRFAQAFKVSPEQLLSNRDANGEGGSGSSGSRRKM